MFSKLSKWIKFGLLAVWLVVMILIGAKLAQQNQDVVQLKLLVWQVPEATSGMVFGATLLIGVLLGLLAFVPGFLALKLRMKGLQKKLHKMETLPHPASLPKVE